MRGAAHLAPGPELRVVAALQHSLCAVMGPRRRLVHVLDARSGALERLWRVPSAATCAAGGAEHPLAVGCADGSLWVWAGGGAEEAVAKRQRVDASALVPAHDVCDDRSVGHARVADGVPLAWVALAGPDSPDCFFGLSAAPCEVHLAHLGSTRLLGVLSCPVATMLRVPARGGGGDDVRSRPLLQWLLGEHYTADRACLVMGHTDGSISVALEGMPAHGRRTVVPPSSSPCVHLGLVHLECLQGGDGSEKDANACVAVLRCGTVLVLCAAGVRKYSAGVAVASCTTLSTLVVLVPVASDEPLAPVVLNLEGLGTQLVTLLLGEGEAALSATCVAALDGHVWTLGADGALWRHAVHDGARLPLSLGAYHGLDVAGAVRAIVGTAAQLQHLDEAHRTANVALTELNCALRFMGASEAQLSAEIRAEVAVSGAALLLVTLHNNTAVHMSPRWSANVQLCDRDVVVWECTVALARGIAPGSAVALPVSPSPVPTSRPLLCRVYLVYVPLDWAALAAQRAPAPQDAVRVHVGVQRIGALDWQFRASPGLDRALVPGLQPPHCPLHGIRADQPCIARVFRFSWGGATAVVALDAESVFGHRMVVEVRDTDVTLTCAVDGPDVLAWRAALVRRWDETPGPKAPQRLQPKKDLKALLSACQQVRASLDAAPGALASLAAVRQGQALAVRVLDIYNRLRAMTTCIA